MKIAIRKGVFETNSSSVHSICISKEPIKDLNFPEKLFFRHGEFGWSDIYYRTPEEKAAYLYQAILAHPNVDKKWDSVEKRKDRLFQMLSEAGISIDFEAPKIDEWGFEYGYIDHVSDLGDFVDKLLKNKKRLLNFLFSYKSYVHTGNDNEDTILEINEDYPHEEFYKGN